jgi:NAD(P)-dependent dehydrogenase (short-subunit alcohol dehydrogenase family)
MRFENKLAVVTGGTTGIGFAIARKLSSEGARVIITGQDSGRITEAAQSLGSNVIGVVADQSDPAKAAIGIEAAINKAGGKLDVLILNAGVTIAAATAMETSEAFDRQMAINLKSPFFTMQALAPLLNDGASVVANTTCLNQLGMPGMAVYSATKAALRSMVRTWAAEFMDRRIRVNAVAPGPTNTPIYGKLGLPQDHLTAMAGAIMTKVPMNRFAEPEEIAGAFLFLASDEASYITGEEITVDGGWAQL